MILFFGLGPLRGSRLHAGDDGHHPQPRPERRRRRRAWPSRPATSASRTDSYCRFIQMSADVVIGSPEKAHGFEGWTASTSRKSAKGVSLDTELNAEDLKENRCAPIRPRHKKALGQRAFPQDPKVQLMEASNRCGVPLVEQRARYHYRRMNDIPGSLGHRRERAGDGVRQHGRRLRHGRRLHARPLDRRKQVLRRIPDERAGRGRGGGHPHAAAAFETREGKKKAPR